jgi:hypothetical protein
VANVPNGRNFPLRPHVLDRTFPGVAYDCRRVGATAHDGVRILEEEFPMDGIIYLVGLIVIVMAVLSLFGLR